MSVHGGGQAGPSGRSRSVDLVKNASFCEMLGLRRPPATEDLIDGEQLHLRKHVCIALRKLGIARAVVVLCRKLLPLLAVEEAEIRFGRGAGAILVDDFVDERNRRYFGFEIKVKSPAPAFSISARPVILTFSEFGGTSAPIISHIFFSVISELFFVID